MLLMVDAAPRVFRLSFSLSLSLRAAPRSDAIRTLRILNSKLQNMLSGRYKSKVGPRASPVGHRGVRERVLYPSPPSLGFHAGVRALRVLRSRPGPRNIGATPSRIGERGRVLFSVPPSMPFCLFVPLSCLSLFPSLSPLPRGMWQGARRCAMVQFANRANGPEDSYARYK